MTRFDFKHCDSQRMFELGLLTVIAIALSAFAISSVWGMLHHDSSDDGIPSQLPTVVVQGDMSDAEARRYVDGRAAVSQIVVNLALEMALIDGKLRVNFIVHPDNNGLSERFEISQFGEIVYSSSVLRPGEALTWAEVPDVVIGKAVVTVHAVDSNGHDSGSPISVEVDVVSDEGTEER